MVYEDADATLLRLFESFMESAPQLVLQIYILIKDPHANREPCSLALRLPNNTLLYISAPETFFMYPMKKNNIVSDSELTEKLIFGSKKDIQKEYFFAVK